MDADALRNYNIDMDNAGQYGRDLEPDQDKYMKDDWADSQYTRFIKEYNSFTGGNIVDHRFSDEEVEALVEEADRNRPDPTNPSHYQGGVPKAYEHHRIVALHGLDYHIGCATKYLFRAGKKSSAHLDDTEKEIQDLEKARAYIKMKIELLKERQFPDNDWK